MSPEPAELQILRQTLGHDLGSMVFALNVLAGSAAQQAQQIAEQAQRLEQVQDTRPSAAPASPNPWTEPDPAAEAS